MNKEMIGECEVFNQMAEYYDKYRPNYPNEVITAIIEKASLSAGSKLLEIGSGSGKATEQFADFGFDICCIEPGADLVKIGIERFKGRNITFVVSRFEDYLAPKEWYDTIFSAQAFHWLSKPYAYKKCAQLLRDGGYLAPFWNIELIQNTDFDIELLKFMHKYDAFTSTLREEDYQKRVSFISNEITESSYFAKPEIIQSYWEKNYTADEYFGFLLTGNIFVQNSIEIKRACFEELKQLAAKNNGIKRKYVCELYLSKKL